MAVPSKKGEGIFDISQLPQLFIERPHSMPSAYIPNLDTLRRDYSFEVDGSLVYARDLCGGPPGGAAEQCRKCEYFIVNITREARGAAEGKIPRKHIQVVNFSQAFNPHLRELVYEGQSYAEAIDNADKFGDRRWAVSAVKFVHGWDQKKLVDQKRALYYNLGDGDTLIYVPVPTQKGELGMVFGFHPSKSFEREKSRGSAGRLVYGADLINGNKTLTIVSNEQPDLPRHTWAKITDFLERLQSLAATA